MASKAFLFAVIVVAATAAAPAFAVDYVVGDDDGWKLNVNYTAWAQGKMFYVGDTIAFKYAVGVHNVYKVNGSAFRECWVPPPSEALRTGNDIISLATPGRKWYLCGVGNGTHCESGMKLVITVMSYAPMSAPAPAPAPFPIYGAPTKKPITIWRNWKLKFHF
ncbi:blue copper protein 1a-like [Salvia miltiorrhiza]|uniref:blue copper protein 1a-like n=1 Tax=Salvia miltiorrhiza TaxID=226208 RepID=UPI0025AC7396|nr:blue copper protein 1a-like [Salvia miltiorrhiza]